jgi:xanthine permease XanP
MNKPGNLIYGLDEKPPILTTIVLGFQHTTLILIGCIFPVIIVRAMGASISPHNARAFVSITLLASGIITILQALRKRGIGSGYLCPAMSGPTYFNATYQAALLGGLPLIFGMTAFVGFIECLFSRVINRLRPLFPPEVAGTVVALVGIVVIPVAVKSLVGIGFNDTKSDISEVSIGFLTLTILVGLNVFSKGKLRLFSAILGMMAGYLLSYFFGIFDPGAFDQVKNASFFAVPYIENISWDFNHTLIIPFMIASFSSVLKVTGDIATCQRINDAKWKRIDMKNVSGGILVDGMGSVLIGLLGSFGQSTSSSNVGLSLGTGATSRVIAWSTGIIIIMLAFLPKLANIFIIMPRPVMGAMLIFSVSFMIVTGLQMIMSRMLDARKIFVVGISLIFGLSVDMVPQIYQNIHPSIQPLFSSSLSLGAVTVVLLNLIMRIGIKRKASVQLDKQDLNTERIFQFIEEKGQLWGARQEIMTRISFAISEIIEKIYRQNKEEVVIDTDITFDEYKLEVVMEYRGELIKLSHEEPSGIEKIGESIEALSGYLISRYCDRIKVSEKKGKSKIIIHFEH